MPKGNSETLIRLYGLRDEKGFIFYIKIGHYKHRDNILKKQSKRAKSPTFCTRNSFHVQKATVFAHTPSVVEGTANNQSFRFSGPIPFASVRANGMGAPCTPPSNQPLIAKTVISTIPYNHMVYHRDIE